MIPKLMPHNYLNHHQYTPPHEIGPQHSCLYFILTWDCGKQHDSVPAFYTNQTMRLKTNTLQPLDLATTPCLYQQNLHQYR